MYIKKTFLNIAQVYMFVLLMLAALQCVFDQRLAVASASLKAPSVLKN